MSGVIDNIGGNLGKAWARIWRKDGEDKKRGPNSLYAVLRAIRRRWNRESGNIATVEDFAVEISDAVARVDGKYPKGVSATQLARKIENFETKNQNIDYVYLRYFAEHLEISVPLLLFYSHVVGDASHGNGKKYICELIDRYISAISCFKNDVENSQDIYKLLFEFFENKDGPVYEVDIGPLNKMRDAYQSRQDSMENYNSN